MARGEDGATGRAALALAAILFLAASTPSGFAEEPFYRGRQVKILIGFSAGDSYDLWARLVARHMPRFVPGEPVFLPENMPGAGSMVAANHLYNVSPRDGTEFGTFSRNLATMAILGRPNVHYDPRRFGWIGSAEAEDRVCIVRRDAPAARIEDVFHKEVLMGGTGAGTIQSFLPRMLDKLLGAKFRVVEGYKGSGDVILAMHRGEVDGECVTMSQLRGPQRDLIESGEVRILLNAGSKPLFDHPEVPSIDRFVATDEQRQILAFINATLGFGRPFAAPPDLPGERLATLRKAFADMAADAAFLADARRQNYVVTYTSGEALESLAESMYRTPQSVIDRAAAMMEGN